MIVPAVGRSRPTIIRATVVLPLPDSPTIASDRPGSRSNVTSSTATWVPKTLRSPWTDSTGPRWSAIDGLPFGRCGVVGRCGAGPHPAAQVGGPLAADLIAVQLGELLLPVTTGVGG